MPGVIAAGGPETAVAGATILQQGGNAVDAAVAAAFASFVAETGVVHLGGSGIAHIYSPQTGRSVVYDFFSNMPGLGREALPAHMDFAEVMIDFGATTQRFHLGRASVAVPGNIAGLCQMAADFGRLPLAQLLEPAIQLARDGVAIHPFQADTCDLLTPLYTHTAGMREIFARNGRIIQPYEHLHIPHLAETLEALAKEGADLARNGRLAQAILDDQAAHGGLLTAEDLARYRVRPLEPIRLPYREYEILLPPPSSTGGVLTAFALKLMAAFDVAQMAHGSAGHLQLLFEVMSAANRARRDWDMWQDSLPIDEAMARFLADGYVFGYEAEVRAALLGRRPSPTTPEPIGPGNTSHLSVVDADGLAVSLTTTAGESAGYVVPGTGYIPNNICGEADLHPAGFHTRPAGQRIPTMMTPTIVLHKGQTRLVLGSGGSERIRSAILQVLNNLLDYHMKLDEAVNIRRVHVENGVLQLEAGFDLAAAAELEGWGYAVNRWQNRSIYFGGAHSVSRTPAGRLVSAGDNRRGGSTAEA
ncbi:MAG: gamma-glutamyltransferase [Ardenticatenaceae bacterium]|nr:gamma-glutamyltransferase [Anaerolineales bacterium]MCB8922794.1 gamma-glutamyltransferase [Ardenticatenaceae bacterium]MCB8991927.1 gamma-glutamyltransferase [Ardenticatenaceae bacterium]MCB9004737.1 gamma-glutamyltransferase [Ardenticatenaceae bacterium]